VSLDGGPAAPRRAARRAGRVRAGASTASRACALAGGDARAGGSSSRRLHAHRSRGGAGRVARRGARAAPPRLRSRELHFNLAHHSSHYYRNAAFRGLPGERRCASCGAPRGPRRARLDRATISRARARARCATASRRSAATRSRAPSSSGPTRRPSLHDLGAAARQPARLRPLARAAARAARVDAARARRSRAPLPGCFSPCEAVPAMVAHPLRTALASVASASDDGAASTVRRARGAAARAVAGSLRAASRGGAPQARAAAGRAALRDARRDLALQLPLHLLRPARARARRSAARRARRAAADARAARRRSRSASPAASRCSIRSSSRCSRARRLGLLVHLNTNGSRLAHARRRPLLAARPPLDQREPRRRAAGDPRRLRGVPGSFEQIRTRSARCSPAAAARRRGSAS
jgi:hypothetical protein